jgi:hypothetical protein
MTGVFDFFRKRLKYPRPSHKNRTELFDKQHHSTTNDPHRNKKILHINQAPRTFIEFSSSSKENLNATDEQSQNEVFPQYLPSPHIIRDCYFDNKENSTRHKSPRW